MKHKKPPPKLCQRISDEDQRRLRLHFADLATRAADKHGVKVFQIREPRKYRAKAVCRAREEVVLALRTTVWYQDASKTTVTVRDGKRCVIYWAGRLLAFDSRPFFTDTEAPREPISTPMIAALFPCNHSAIVLLLQRVRDRQAAAAEKSNAESSDDGNRNSDRDRVGCGRGDNGGAGQGGIQPMERALNPAT